jgi:uncharacterized protein (DUF433 family)
MSQETNLPDHSDRAHAVFGPSSLKYYAKCPGYHGRDGTNPAAEMGTRIHEALEVRDPSALQTEQEQQIYDTMLKDELEVFDQLFGGTEGVTILREHRLVLDIPVQTPTFGTSDIVSYKGTIGLQVDYKSGVSKIDEVRDNWQAKAYVVGMFQMFPFLERIHFVFLIPQRGEVLADFFTRDELPRLVQEIADVVSVAEKIRPKWDNGNTPELEELGPSTNCRFCRHEDICPALGAVAVAVARKYNPLGIPDGPIDSTNISDPQVIGKLYTVAKILEEWASGIKRKAVLMAEDGVEFDDLKLRSLGSLKKTVDSAGLAELGIQHGLTKDEIIAAANLTMNQLAEAIGSKAARGRKTSAIRSFEEDALDRGVVEVGPVRHTLSSK